MSMISQTGRGGERIVWRPQATAEAESCIRKPAEAQRRANVKVPALRLQTEAARPVINTFKTRDQVHEAWSNPSRLRKQFEARKHGTGTPVCVDMQGSRSSSSCLQPIGCWAMTWELRAGLVSIS